MLQLTRIALIIERKPQLVIKRIQVSLLSIIKAMDSDQLGLIPLEVSFLVEFFSVI